MLRLNKNIPPALRKEIEANEEKLRALGKGMPDVCYHTLVGMGLEELKAFHLVFLFNMVSRHSGINDRLTDWFTLFGLRSSFYYDPYLNSELIHGNLCLLYTSPSPRD